MNTPPWARVKPPNLTTTETAPPQSPETFALFAKTFAERYGNVVDYYQIWDEPNLDDAWGLLNPNPSDYVTLLSEAYIAIHNVDPSATVISAGLAPTSETGGQNISDIRYLHSMYQRGAKDVMDVVSGKPYGFSASPLDRSVDESILNFSRLVALREVMVTNDDGTKPLWASNWGWNALPDNWQGSPSIWGHVTQDEQIQYTLQALDRAHRELPWLGAMILHYWQPEAESTDPQWGFALIDQENQSTALLKAIQNYPHPELPQNGLYHPLTPSARYSGVWEFSQAGADIGWLETTDSQLEFDFVGRDIAMLLREGNYVAFLYPTIDGQQANATPRDSNGNAYVFLRSNNAVDAETDENRTAEATNLILIAQELLQGSHTLHIKADKGWDQWAIAGFAVSSGNLSSPYDNQLTVGIIATVVSGMLVFISALRIPWQILLPATSIIKKHLSFTAQTILSGITSLAMMIAMLLTWSSSGSSILVRSEINLFLALITGGLLYLSPHFIISVATGLILFVLFYHRPKTGLILTLFWAPFFLFPIELFTFAFPMVEVMIFLTTGAWLLKRLVVLGKQLQIQNSAYPLFSITDLRRKISTIDLCILGIALIAMASIFWSQRSDVAMTELRQFILEPALFYFLLRRICPSNKVITQLVMTLIISGVLVALIGLIQYAQGEAIITAEEGARRLASVYGSPNNVALLLGRTIPFALAFVLILNDRNHRILAGIAITVMSIALALTQSVGAILLGIPGALVIVFLAIYQRRAIIPIFTSAIIGVIGFGILTRISARFANILDFTSGTNFFRLRVWESALEIIEDFPFTGIGLDQFLYVYSGEYIRPDAIWDRNLSHPHNFVLDFWIRLGIVGVILFFFIQILFWRDAYRILKHTRNKDHVGFALIVGLMGSMANLLAHGLIDNSVFVYDLAFIFMFQLGMLTCLSNNILIEET